MSLIEEIEKFMNSSNSSINYRYLNIGGNFLYVEGVKSVVNFSGEKMQFQLKKSMLEVCGDELLIKYLDKSTIVLQGKIVSVVVKWNSIFRAII